MTDDTAQFDPEAEIWYNIPEFNLLQRNVTVPGLSPLFKAVHCTDNYDVCQVVVGEAGLSSLHSMRLRSLTSLFTEINAAATMTALLFSNQFNFTQTYFFAAGIAGINPKVGPTCSVTFAKYAIQVALQYEFDARELPGNFTTGSVIRKARQL